MSETPSEPPAHPKRSADEPHEEHEHEHRHVRAPKVVLAAALQERTRDVRRRRRRRRRVFGVLAALLPVAWMVWSDFARRGNSIVGFPKKYVGSYAGGVAESLLLWTPLLVAAARRRGPIGKVGRVLFVVLFTIVMGVESAFHAFWNVYLCIDGQLHSKSITQSVFGTLPLGRPLVLFHLVVAALVGLLAVVYARRLTRTGPWTARGAFVLALAAWAGATFLPTSYRGIQASPPDALYVHGMVALVKERLGITHEAPDRRVQRRDPEPVPPLTARPARKRNVVLLLEESQRGDVTCVTPDPRCALSTPWSNAVAPNRMPLREMRSNASTTAISISNIWSGVRPTESRELLHSVPLLWEYAAAAGYDTAYWTSQNLMFGNARVYIEDLPISHGCVATHLDSTADLDTGARDDLLAEWVKKDWPEMKEPFFAVIHFSNPHYPYIYDEQLAPFRPSEMAKSPEKNGDYLNYYRNVVYLSDSAVGEIIRFIRSTDAGKRTVLVYTADHGESFREHWQMGHTSSVYDEEIHVPAWIDAPPGTLSDEERANLVGAADALLWHMDLAPTFLDLLGVWDDPALAPFKARMMGHPITRKERTVAPVPLTNCTWVWECAFRNWGLMQGSRKIEAREWDGNFHCFDVLKDPTESTDLGERMCAPLPDLARDIFHVMPNVTPPGRPVVDWGK